MATRQANKYKEEGNKFFLQGNHQKAIECYTYATEVDPKNPIFFTNRSTAYFKMNRFDKSLRDADKAIKLDKKWAKGYYRRGLVLMEQKQWKEALKALEQAEKLKPKNASFKTAVINCRKAFMDGKSAGEILKMDGNKLFKSGKIDEAIVKYTEALQACDREKGGSNNNSLKADIYANRALCYKQQYSPKKVIADTTKALEISPQHVKALIRRAQARESMELFKEALEDFQRASFLAPGSSVAVQGASRVRSGLRKFEQSKK